MKIVSSGRVLNSSEFYKRKQRRRRVKLILISIGFIFLISLSVYVLRLERFQIKEVVGREEVISRARELLEGYYLWIIPRTSALFYPRREIKETLLTEFPRFKSISLDVDSFHTLSINVLERIPFAMYCRDTSECYFIDEDGLIFALAPSFSGTVYFTYTTEDPITNPIGERFVSVEDFRNLSEFIETLATLSIYPKELETSKDEYRLLLPTGGEILWRRESDLNLVYGNLEAFLFSDSIRSQEGFLNRVSHLDLRTKNKVFYKFK